MPGINNRAAILLIFLFAFALRFWHVEFPDYFIGDEGLFIPSAENFIRNGLYAPMAWHHPPLFAYLTVAAMKLFGNNPYGWRMVNVIFGSLSVLMLMLLALRLFPDRRVAWLSGVFFAVEPFHIVISRTSFSEVPAIFFFLFFLYVISNYLREGDGPLLWAGIPLGLALAGKWYFIAPLLASFAFILANGWKKHTVKERLNTVSRLFTCLVTAAGVYLLSFYPWFTRGYGLHEFILWQYDAYALLQSIEINHFANFFLKSSPSVPWLWFVKPLIYGYPVSSDQGWTMFFVFMNNPPVWLLVIPASLYSVYRIRSEKSPGLILAFIMFSATYLQFLLVNRPVFLYSSFPVLPFAYMLTASAAVDITGESDRGRKIFLLIMCGAILWGLYLYPFVTGRMVPAFLYDYLLPAMPH